MKLSELSTDRALDVLCEITPSVASIMEDEKIVRGLVTIMPDQPDQSDKGDKGDRDNEENGIVTGIRMMGGLSKMIPVLLRDHRSDMYNILSVLNEKTVDEIAAQPVTDTVRQVREAFRDTELLSFFRSSAQQAESGPSAPSAGSPDSE